MFIVLNSMTYLDGPSSINFLPLILKGNARLADLAGMGISEDMASVLTHAPDGECVSWGIPSHHEQTNPSWGHSQTRADVADSGEWVNWLWAWRNPEEEKAITGFRFEPGNGLVLLSGLAGGRASTHPLRWDSRRKIV